MDKSPGGWGIVAAPPGSGSPPGESRSQGVETPPQGFVDPLSLSFFRKEKARRMFAVHGVNRPETPYFPTIQWHADLPNPRDGTAPTGMRTTRSAQRDLPPVGTVSLRRYRRSAEYSSSPNPPGLSSTLQNSLPILSDSPQFIPRVVASAGNRIVATALHALSARFEFRREFSALAEQSGRSAAATKSI